MRGYFCESHILFLPFRNKSVNERKGKKQQQQQQQESKIIFRHQLNTQQTDLKRIISAVNQFFFSLSYRTMNAVTPLVLRSSPSPYLSCMFVPCISSLNPFHTLFHVPVLFFTTRFAERRNLWPTIYPCSRISGEQKDFTFLSPSCFGGHS